MTGVIKYITRTKGGFTLVGEPDVDGKPHYHNLSKYEKGVTLEGFAVGDAIDFAENNKGYITKLVKTGTAQVSGPEALQPGVPAGRPAESITAVGDKDLRITRLSVISSATGLTQLLRPEGMDLDDTRKLYESVAESLLSFAMTGKFLAAKKEE